jgi:tousled-like kinase
LVYFYFPGSSHSDKELDTPEKITVSKVPVERKRKRKADDGSSGATGGNNPSSTTPSAKSNKKINDYFTSKVTASSPIRHSGAKSPSPHPTSKNSVSHNNNK